MRILSGGPAIRRRPLLNCTFIFLSVYYSNFVPNAGALTQGERQAAVECQQKLLLGSGGFGGVEGGLNFLAKEIDTFLGPQITEVLIIGYASSDKPKILATIEKFHVLGRRKYRLIRDANAAEDATLAQAFLVWGGNTYRLLEQMRAQGLMGLVRNRVRAGVPYIGISAGTNLAQPTIQTTNDWPIVMLPTLNALDLIPFQINPHFYPTAAFFRPSPTGDFVEHGGETREDRIREFHEANSAPVLGLPEASFVRIKDGEAQIISHPRGMEPRLYRAREPAVKLPLDADISFLLKRDG